MFVFFSVYIGEASGIQLPASLLYDGLREPSQATQSQDCRTPKGPTTNLMVVAVFNVVSLQYIVHAACWAGACLVATTTLAVHWADVSGGVLLAGTVGFCFAGGSIAVVVLVVTSASGKAKCGDCQNGKEKFFHD